MEDYDYRKLVASECRALAGYICRCVPRFEERETMSLSPKTFIAAVVLIGLTWLAAVSYLLWHVVGK